jgi:hypothetical protein
MAERSRDGDVHEDWRVGCRVCGTEYEIDTFSGFGGIYASLADGSELVVEKLPDPDDIRDDDAVVYDASEYEDYLRDFAPENDTVGAYNTTRRQLLDLIEGHGADSSSLLNRMIYSQFITAMEAYLADKLLRLSIDHPEIKKRLISKAGFLQGQTLKLTEVLLDPSKAENTFKVGLQKILYHDLDRVEKLYQIVLKASFYPADPTVKTELEKVILIRHDCVHRNGVNMNGIIHTFNESTIHALSGKVTALVDRLEDQIKKAIAALPAGH